MIKGMIKFLKCLRYILSVDRSMLTIISVGSNKMFKAQEIEYLARIKRFAKAELVELKEDKSRHENEVIRKEGEMVLSR